MRKKGEKGGGGCPACVKVYCGRGLLLLCDTFLSSSLPPSLSSFLPSFFLSFHPSFFLPFLFPFLPSILPSSLPFLLLPLPTPPPPRHFPGYVECILPVNVRPTHVSISYLQKSELTNRLQIIYPGTLIRNFTVCYSVLHSGFSSPSQLIQSIEMNRILGAEHFVVYNYSISPAVDQILQRYQQDGLVTVVPWPVPTWEVQYYGQMAAVNDCGYRNRNISRYVVVVDTDEFIIPRKNLNWMELLDSISAEEYGVSAFMHRAKQLGKGPKTIGSFEFRSSLFAVSTTPIWSELPSQFHFSEEEKNNIQQFNLFTLSQFWRSEEIYPPQIRSKYIIRPELVYIMGIHFVHSFVGNVSAVTVDVNSALVHHYRTLRYGNVKDTSIIKFKNRLYPRLIQQCQRFPSIFTF
ncbi:unnamed protein product [Candidula unifasciata]|uniref:Glycosyltransferase family 92 protein n=1 Tax=Candidula unifasciata TaxID=100452 RepID=A0A8S3ZNR3_9EUPU|nr:unnamed protein product [Candidula unifasciata]